MAELSLVSSAINYTILDPESVTNYSTNKETVYAAILPSIYRVIQSYISHPVIIWLYRFIYFTLAVYLIFFLLLATCKLYGCEKSQGLMSTVFLVVFYAIVSIMPFITFGAVGTMLKDNDENIFIVFQQVLNKMPDFKKKKIHIYGFNLFLFIMILSLLFVGNFLLAFYIMIYFIPFCITLSLTICLLEALNFIITDFQTQLHQSITQSKISNSGGTLVDISKLKISYVTLHDVCAMFSSNSGLNILFLCSVNFLYVIEGLHVIYMNLESSIVFAICFTILNMVFVSYILYMVARINENGAIVIILFTSLFLHQHTSCREDIKNDIFFLQCLEYSKIQITFWGYFALRYRMMYAIIATMIGTLVPLLLN